MTHGIPHPLHLYRANVPDAEYAEHLRKLADAAFAERAAEQKSLRAVLRADEDVYGIGPLALAQEKARIWRRIRARAAGHPEMEGQAAGAVFAPEDGKLIEEVRRLRMELRNHEEYGTEYEEWEAARLFLVHTDFLDSPEEGARRVDAHANVR